MFVGISIRFIWTQRGIAGDDSGGTQRTTRQTVIPAQAGTQRIKGQCSTTIVTATSHRYLWHGFPRAAWIPACAGKTVRMPYWHPW